MVQYKNEVERNNYLPNDFLIIFPIMKDNIIANELETKIQEYWTQTATEQNDKYIQYVYLHKHTEGTVINTNDSINATRIMSIKSSKGDGRKVVFILGITENTLKMVSNKEIGLVYESYLHVALTRAKQQIYFGLNKNNDDIHRRFGEIGYVEYLTDISKKIRLEKIKELANKDKLIELFNNNNIHLDNDINKCKIEPSGKVDWGYHCIKYHTFYYNVILNIINNKHKNASNKYSQLFVKLDIISNYDVGGLDVNTFYKFLSDYQYNLDTFPCFPLCKLSNKPEYKKYYNKIKETIKKFQEKYKSNKICELNVYESIILIYMIQIETNKKYADMSPMDIYNITDCFQKNTNKSGIKDYKNINWNIF